jgi:hypothetical protein
MKTIVHCSRCWMNNTAKWVSTSRQRFLASHLGKFILRLVADIRWADIGSRHRQNLPRHGPCCILWMSVNRESMMFSFAFWLIYVLIGCRHAVITNWQPLLAKTEVKCSLPHPENVCQRRVNSFGCYIFVNQDITRIVAFILGLLLAMTGKNTIHQW